MSNDTLVTILKRHANSLARGKTRMLMLDAASTIEQLEQRLAASSAAHRMARERAEEFRS